MTRLRKFLLLPPAERGLLAKAVILLWGVRLGLWLLPFQILRHLLTPMPHTASRSHKADQSSPDRIAWAVAVVSGYVPNATCLSQALAIKVLLEREGYPACLRIGVVRREGRRLQAHAWVESRGKVLVGGSELEQYTLLSAFEKERP